MEEDQSPPDYIIIYGRSTEFLVAAAELEQGVKRKLAEGWTVTGGVAFAHTEIKALRGEQFLLMQAMVNVTRKAQEIGDEEAEEEYTYDDGVKAYSGPVDDETFARLEREGYTIVRDDDGKAIAAFAPKA